MARQTRQYCERKKSDTRRKRRKKVVRGRRKKWSKKERKMLREEKIWFEKKKHHIDVEKKKFLSGVPYSPDKTILREKTKTYRCQKKPHRCLKNHIDV